MWALVPYSFSVLKFLWFNIKIKIFKNVYKLLQNCSLPSQLLPCQSNTMLCVKQPRQMILYQGHLNFFRILVTLHQPGRKSCSMVFSHVEISAVMFSLPTLLFQFTYCIYFVFSVIFCETLHFCSCKNPNHVTE